MDMLGFGLLSVGFIFSLVATHALIGLAPRLALLDHPDGRKQHADPTPMVGGLAMLIALLAAAQIFLPDYAPQSQPLFIATFIALLGVLDDRFGIKALPRLAAQALLAIGMVYWTGIQLHELGNLTFSGNIELGAFALPMTVIGVVGVINAVNFSDGLDGLAGGLVLVAVGFLLVFSLRAGGGVLSLELITLLGVLLGFWVLNARYFRRNRAAVFMGDAGSMLLGFLLAWYFIKLSQGDGRILSPVTTLWIFALPLFDTVGMMLRRILRGRSPFAADREHLHHIFLHAGYSVCKTVSIMLLLALALGMVGFIGEVSGVPEAVMFWLFITLFGLYFIVMMHAWKVMRWVRAL